MLRSWSAFLSVFCAVFFLFSIPFVIGEPSVSESSFIRNGEVVEYFSPASQMMAFLQFTVTDALDVDSITVDYSAIDPSKSPADLREELLPSDCVSGSDGLSCFITNLVLNMQESPVAVTYTLQTIDDVEVVVEKSHSFTVDDTRPVVTFIGPRSCQGDECFISDGLTNIYIDMQDSTATFDRGLISLNIGNQPAPVSSCEGMSCWAKTVVNCDDGELLRLSVGAYQGVPSQDDAGNALVTGDPFFATCDAQEPDVSDEFTLVSASGFATKNPATGKVVAGIGDTVTLSFNVTESSSPSLKVSATPVEFRYQEPIEGSCSLVDDTEGLWSCSLQFSVGADKLLEDYAFEVAVEDFVGHVAKKSFVFDVLQTSDEAPDFWSGIASPDRQYANRRYIAYSPKEFYFSLKPTTSSPNAALLDVALSGGSDRCLAATDDPDRGLDSELAIEVVSFDERNIFVKGTLLQNTRFQNDSISRLQYTCNLDLLTVTGGYVSNQYEAESFDVSFTLRDSPTMGDMTRTEIEESLEEFESGGGFVQNASRMLQTAKTVCDGLTMLSSAGGTAEGAASVLLATPPTKPTGTILNELGEQFLKIRDKTCTTLLCKMCNIIACKMPYNKVVGETLNSYALLNAPAEFLGYDSYSETLDPYDSWLTAAATLCPTAMVYHAEQSQAITCNYLQCLSQEVLAGTATVADCGKRRGYSTCQYVWGQVFNGVPVVGMVKDTLRSITEMAKDPLTLFSSGTLGFACKAAKITPDSTAGAICGAFIGIQGAVESGLQVKNIVENGMKLTGGSLANSQCNTILQHIDRRTMYWMYEDDEPNFGDEFFADVRERYDKFNIDGDLRCTKDQGCKGLFKDAKGEESIVSFFPNIHDKSVRICIDGSCNDAFTLDWYTPEKINDKRKEYDKDLFIIARDMFDSETFASGEEFFDEGIYKQSSQQFDSEIDRINGVISTAISTQTDLESRIKNLEAEYGENLEGIPKNTASLSILGNYVDYKNDLKNAKTNEEENKEAREKLISDKLELDTLWTTRDNLPADEGYLPSDKLLESNIFNKMNYLDLPSRADYPNADFTKEDLLESLANAAGYTNKYVDDLKRKYEQAGMDVDNAMAAFANYNEAYLTHDAKLDKALNEYTSLRSGYDLIQNVNDADKFDDDSKKEYESAKRQLARKWDNLDAKTKKELVDSCGYDCSGYDIDNSFEDFQFEAIASHYMLNPETFGEIVESSNSDSRKLSGVFSSLKVANEYENKAKDSTRELVELFNSLPTDVKEEFGYETLTEEVLNDPAKLAELEKAFKEKEKDAKKEFEHFESEKDLIAAERLQELIETLESDWGSGGQMLRSTLRFSNTMNQVTPYISNFIAADAMRKYTEFYNKVFGGSAVGQVVSGRWEIAACDRKLKDDAGDLIVGETLRSGTPSTVHVEGFRDVSGFASLDTDKYIYKVNVYASNAHESDELPFVAFLRTGSKTLNVVNRTVIEPGSVFSSVQGNFIEVSSEEIFDEVCIDFDVRNLYKWFPISGRRNGDTLFCRDLEVLS